MSQIAFEIAIIFLLLIANGAFAMARVADIVSVLAQPMKPFTPKTVTDPRIWAVGECAGTGLHGANRLASNSLLECLVSAKATAQADAAELKSRQFHPPAPRIWDRARSAPASELVILSPR